MVQGLRFGREVVVVAVVVVYLFVVVPAGVSQCPHVGVRLSVEVGGLRLVCWPARTTSMEVEGFPVATVNEARKGVGSRRTAVLRSEVHFRRVCSYRVGMWYSETVVLANY